MAILDGWRRQRHDGRERPEGCWTWEIAARSQGDEGGRRVMILLRWPFGDRELRKAARPDEREV